MERASMEEGLLVEEKTADKYGGIGGSDDGDSSSSITAVVVMTIPVTRLSVFSFTLSGIMLYGCVIEEDVGGEFIIAFTYRRNGVLVSCKYRDVNKNFWQEKDTEKIFYGVDDIKEASDIIIVEGEIDKLSMEEAGFYNCVSVPDGAPPSVSTKVFKSEEKDIKYQYLWNCKEYLEKASRIILATDGDEPGLALAEELARRLGRERCWRVKWPKKTEVEHFKDANEVLMYLGPDVLKKVIENAEIYPIQGLFNFSHYFNEIDAYYHHTLGFELGVSTGWRALNGLYNAPKVKR
ncbi:twinkle homolog protein, chloroplastic/mitochondrial-like [Vitis riparia]|uniref:twinkle homolog protein, chloroplastic/mitochondrial-like n=1 Tax=Vitis riparia TaxID=96939 RepID=UPI00155B3837|nr:twinkle homolog protein, chloroplastic/mitochondrial-like [Vitis riparia]XP_034697023.1 twinkle homolog protein, chloroplastic/mitochondrial-like [Vitis riparia]